MAPQATNADDPFARFNDWGHITTPYGPVWTTLSRAVVVTAVREDAGR